MRPPFCFIVQIVLCPVVWAYEAPEDRQNVFSSRACPAFLTFTNAAFLSGTTVELPCHCKPEQVQSVVWFFREHLGSSQSTRVLTDHHGNSLTDQLDAIPHSRGDALRSRFSIRLFSLILYRSRPEDSGVYVCGSTHTDFFSAYDLDIQEVTKVSFTAMRLHPENTTRKSSDQKHPRSNSLQYRLFTSYGPWSVCDRCGVQGQQVRVGLCYVHTHFLHVRYRRTNQTTASCGSGAVPKAFGELKMNGFGAKMEVKSCRVVCQKEASTASKILQMMAFLGYGPAAVKVFYLSHPADRVLTLGCPGARANMAVAWDRGKKPIYRTTHTHTGGSNHGNTEPRVTVDTGHHLLFNPAKTDDSGVYYCWLEGQRSAEIRLLVYAHLGRSHPVTSHPDFPSAMWTVLRCYVVMTTVFCLLLIGRAWVRHYTDTHED